VLIGEEDRRGGVLIAGAEVAGRRADVRLAAGRVAEVAPRLQRQPREPQLDAAGGALLPGLHDHHLHLFALAAALGSVACGPPRVTDAPALARALAQRAAATPRGAWIRGVGYHESVAGPLDRARLDAWVSDRPLRVQHRSGQCWMLNGAACARLGLDAGADHPGVERDARGRATGRLFRADAWLREQPGLGSGDPPDLAPVGRLLARRGVTGVTDATPGNGPAELAAFVRAAESGALPQRLHVMGGRKLPGVRDAAVSVGPVKLWISENDPPDPDALAAEIAAAHAEGRPVAVHCVTRAEGVLAAAALAAAGARPGDRIEHAAVAPPELVVMLAALPVTVVVQPNLVVERGDAYLRDVEPADRPWLHRARGLEAAGLALAAGSDAPFGEPDPWLALRAAVQRRTAAGAPLGPAERLAPERALDLFLGPPEAPGGRPRRVAPGAPADLVLLDRPWAAARRAPHCDHVVATWRAGALLFRAD